MNHEEYREVRERIGTREKVAALLDKCVSTMERRETGRQAFGVEAEYALLYLEQQERAHPTPNKRTLKARSNGRGSPRQSGRAKAKRERKAAEFARCYHSKERVEFVRLTPCVVPGCTLGPSENAHTVTGGTGRKGPSDSIVPACHKHHREMHRGQRSFEAKYGLDLAAEARFIEAKWRMES